MSEPRRLLADGMTAEGPSDLPSDLPSDVAGLERDLLRSWNSRQPSEDARARVLVAVGAVGAAGLAAAKLGVATATAGGSVAPKAMVTTALMKWIALGGGALAGAVASLAVVAYVRHSAPELPTPAPTPAVAATQGAPHAALPPASPIQDLGDLPAPNAAAPGTHPGPRNDSTPRSTLDDEVTAIDQARRSLAGGDPAATIAALDAYDARYPSGTLAQESTALRIDALLRQGNREAAEQLANRFLAVHGASPYARRIRALLAAH
jgi:hypothetical protein